DVEEGADVRMVERRDDARLALEPLADLGVLGEVRGDQLHRDVTPEARVLRAVDLAHPAGAERGADLVGSELRAGSEAHRSSPALQFRSIAMAGGWGGPAGAMTRMRSPSGE